MSSNVNTTTEANVTTDATTTPLPTTTTETTVPSTTVMTYSSSSKPDSAPNAGTVIAATVGAVVFVIIILFAAAIIRKQYLKQKSKPLPNPLPNPDDIDKLAREANKRSKKNRKKKGHNYEKDPTSTVSIEPEAPSCPAYLAPDPPSSSSVDYENAPSKKKQLQEKKKVDKNPSDSSTKEPKYVNAQKKGQKKGKKKDDEYVDPKPNTAKLYSTAEGAEYYVCDDRKSNLPPNVWKAPPRNPLEDSITSNCSALEYVNLRSSNWKYLELVPESQPVDEPQDLYEPVNS